jgi:hypothetical protein
MIAVASLAGGAVSTGGLASLVVAALRGHRRPRPAREPAPDPAARAIDLSPKGEVSE